MRSVNKVILIGNLTRDPEKRQTGSGQDVVTFGIATNREWITKDNRKMSSAEYHEVVAWAKLADICGKYLKKGKLVYIEGYLKTRSWDNPDGTRKFRTEIVVQDLIMLDKKSDSDYSENDYLPQENEQEESSEAELPENETNEPAETESAESMEATKPQPKEKKESVAQSMDIESDLGL